MCISINGKLYKCKDYVLCRILAGSDAMLGITHITPPPRRIRDDPVGRMIDLEITRTTGTRFRPSVLASHGVRLDVRLF